MQLITEVSETMEHFLYGECFAPNLFGLYL